MEVLSCSSIQYTGETVKPQENSLMDYVRDGETTNVDHEKPILATDTKVDHFQPNFVVAEERMVIDNKSSNCNVDMNGQNLSDDLLDYGDDKLDDKSRYEEACLDFQNSHVVVDTIDSDLSCENEKEESGNVESKWPETDESLPLWVKWRGRWQAGIKCERADWPLATVKAKPTHDRKNYIVIFFPHSRNYSWADTSLVCSIHESPQPIVHRSYKVGVKLVQDLTVARRFIMKKLAIGILNIVDQLPLQVLIESARNVIVWKAYAMEASRCKCYPDLGRMLLKLHNMLLQQYINVEWLQCSFHSWVKRCQNAPSAESIELLKEELVNSILWSEVNSMRDSQGQALGSEWKMWKQEAVKMFSATHTSSSGVDIEHHIKNGVQQQISVSPLTGSLQISRKRPKLEIRRAETHHSPVESKRPKEESTAVIDSGFFAGRSTVTMITGPSVQDGLREVAHRWNEIVPESIQSKDFERQLMSKVVEAKSPASGSKSRQCIAFIESKARQCVRWANDGDDYCCVHLASRFVGNSVKADAVQLADAPMCEGITTFGTKCKHRSLLGSSFCKKHGPRSAAMKIPSSHGSQLTRKHDEQVNWSESVPCKDLVLVGEAQTPLDVDPISAMEAITFEHEHSDEVSDSTEIPRCIGFGLQDGEDHCQESPTKHSLYCEKHIPCWLKRARNGKSRIVSKDVFLHLLRGCSSLKQKTYLHQACELFYKLFKSILSARNQVPREIQFQWALSEASKDSRVAEFFVKLVSNEKERLKKIWGFNLDKDTQVSSTFVEEPAGMAVEGESDHDGFLKCKICSEKFTNDQMLGTHWINTHNREAQWLFRGYACAICLDSFTNRKVLETHVQERHHAQFVEHCMLIQCIPCGSHFGNSDELWSHVLSVHTDGFRQSKSIDQHNPRAVEISQQKPISPNNTLSEKNSNNQGSTVRKFICRFCGLKFDLLPDLGRHHQAAHMGPNLATTRRPSKGIRFYAYRLKSGRLTRPRFKKGLGGAAYRLRTKASEVLKKRMRVTSSLAAGTVSVPPRVIEAPSLGRLTEFQCSAIAQMLFSEAQRTRPRPSNHDILTVARSSCCKVSLQASLEEKYGALPERLFLKAAKLCSEHNTPVIWHQEGFICPKGCKPIDDADTLSVLKPPSIDNAIPVVAPLSGSVSEEWEMDECHYVIDTRHFRHKTSQRTVILCEDISFGKESVPITCVIDKSLIDTLHVPTYRFDGLVTFMPWDSFTYVTKPVLHQSLEVNVQNLQLGCGCAQSACTAETCDHVYLFDTDYENALDISGKPVHGRFPYDDKGRIILEDGFPVYECNDLCKCSRNCPNRVLQNGVRAKLEVFKTVKKGWAVRAGEAIGRGMFVCEFIGEVLDSQEAQARRKRYGLEGCNYFYDVGRHNSDSSRLFEGMVPYVLDASKYGNVSRLINHSCSPNLASRMVLVESMDFHLMHVGLYASCDIACGEELTREYRDDPQPEKGCPCHCGSSSCRGRVH